MQIMVFQLSHYSTCTGTPVEMTMNYMDYTDDRGMYMFSNGQNQEWLQFLFQVEQEQVSEYNFKLSKEVIQ
jgi:hypothetical protein